MYYKKYKLYGTITILEHFYKSSLKAISVLLPWKFWMIYVEKASFTFQYFRYLIPPDASQNTLYL